MKFLNAVTIVFGAICFFAFAGSPKAQMETKAP